MHRRRFIALLAGAITLPCVAAAQQKPLPVIGWLGIADRNVVDDYLSRDSDSGSSRVRLD